MRKEPRSVQLHFVVSGLEAELIKERMAELGITNLSAYLRKMAVDGYIVHLDMSEIRELTRLLRICSNNLNQYAKRAHESGNVYAADIDDLRTRLDELWKRQTGSCEDLQISRKSPFCPADFSFPAR